MGFSRQEYWRGLPFPPLGDLPNLGIEPISPILQADSLTAEPPGKPLNAGFLGKILFCLLSLDECCLRDAQYNHVKGTYTTSCRSEAPRVRDWGVVGHHVAALSETPSATLSPPPLTLGQLSNAVLCSSIS